MNYRSNIELCNEDDDDDDDLELDDDGNDDFLLDDDDDGSDDFLLDDDDDNLESNGSVSHPASNSAFKKRLFQRLGSSLSYPCTLYPCNCGDYVGGLASDYACDNCGHRRHHHEGLT